MIWKNAPYFNVKRHIGSAPYSSKLSVSVAIFPHIDVLPVADY